jgi:hypothetical protein
MNTLPSSLTDFFTPETLSVFVAEYLKLRKDDRWSAIDLVTKVRKNMNNEARMDLQEILDAEAEKLGI